MTPISLNVDLTAHQNQEPLEMSVSAAVTQSRWWQISSCHETLARTTEYKERRAIALYHQRGALPAGSPITGFRESTTLFSVLCFAVLGNILGS